MSGSIGPAARASGRPGKVLVRGIRRVQREHLAAPAADAPECLFPLERLGIRRSQILAAARGLVSAGGAGRMVIAQQQAFAFPAPPEALLPGD